VKRNPDTKETELRFGPVEKLFACPACGYTANSDHNASVNLHRRFFLGDCAVQAFQEYRVLGERQKRERLLRIEEELRSRLRSMHDIVEPPF
jgi:hypothetical protein